MQFFLCTIVTMKHNKKLLKSIINIFNGNVVYLSVNSYYYLDNLNLYLSMYYLYSYIQNQLYANLNKVLNIQGSIDFDIKASDSEMQKSLDVFNEVDILYNVETMLKDKVFNLELNSLVISI